MPDARRATKKLSVRRLFVKDPYNKNSTATVARFGGVSDQFTDNPNVLYDPSKGNDSATTLTASNPPKGSNTGHMKVFRPNRFTLFGGKTIKKR